MSDSASLLAATRAQPMIDGHRHNRDSRARGHVDRIPGNAQRHQFPVARGRDPGVRRVRPDDRERILAAGHPLPQLKITVDSEGYLIADQPFQEPVGPSFWERG